jgi:hypothetical protein
LYRRTAAENVSEGSDHAIQSAAKLAHTTRRLVTTGRLDARSVVAAAAAGMAAMG